MIVLGFILIVAAVVAAVILITQNAGTIDVHGLGHVWSGPAYWLVIAGLAAMAAAALGVAMIQYAGARKAKLRAKAAYVTERPVATETPVVERPVRRERTVVADSPMVADSTTSMPAPPTDGRHVEGASSQVVTEQPTRRGLFRR
jgi:hypothetical protein